jgi:hypothetical protein
LRGRGVDHPPQFRTDVEEWVELQSYISSPTSVRSWHVLLLLHFSVILSVAQLLPVCINCKLYKKCTYKDQSNTSCIIYVSSTLAWTTSKCINCKYNSNICSTWTCWNSPWYSTCCLELCLQVHPIASLYFFLTLFCVLFIFPTFPFLQF